jgi:hypothetical protein
MVKGYLLATQDNNGFSSPLLTVGSKEDIFAEWNALCEINGKDPSVDRVYFDHPSLEGYGYTTNKPIPCEIDECVFQTMKDEGTILTSASCPGFVFKFREALSAQNPEENPAIKITEYYPWKPW